MTKYVIDSYAWVEYLKGSEKGITVRKLIESEENENFTSLIAVSEVVSSIIRQDMDFKAAKEKMFELSNIDILEKEDFVQAGMIHAEMRKTIKDFGLGDCFVLLLARKINAKILTGDLHFKGFKECILI